MFQQAKTIMRHQARIMAYALPPLRRILESNKPRRSPEENVAFWNETLADGPMTTYIEDTISVGGVSSATALLIRHHAVPNPAILDVACGGGSLVTRLGAFRSYTGTDVSSVATARAERRAREALPDAKAPMKFEAADLRLFQPQGPLDVIVFNEVLYFLGVDEALHEVLRYAATLSADGILIISMKDDGKSRAIFRALTAHCAWIDGILWQQKPQTFDFSVRVNRESPGFLVGALRAPPRQD